MIPYVTRNIKSEGILHTLEASEVSFSSEVIPSEPGAVLRIPEQSILSRAHVGKLDRRKYDFNFALAASPARIELVCVFEAHLFPFLLSGIVEKCQR